MEIGFFFWPYNPGLVENLRSCRPMWLRHDWHRRHARQCDGIPGSAALAARVTKKTRVALCVTNLVTRDAAVSAAAIASIARSTWSRP